MGWRQLMHLGVESANQKKEHPAWRLPGRWPGKSVRGGRAFRQGILP